MTGTGTQSDPYVISDFDEFRQTANRGNVSTPHIYITIPSGTVWDMDKYRQPKYQGYTIVGKGVTVNGNNLIIKNLKFDASSSATQSSLLYMGDTLIQNVHFENIILLKSGVYFAYSDGDTSNTNISRFVGCTMTINTISSDVIFNGSVSSFLYFTNCIVRSKLPNGMSFKASTLNTDFDNCILDVDSGRVAGNYSFSIYSFRNSKLQGNLGKVDATVYVDYTQPCAFNADIDTGGELTIREKSGTSGSLLAIINKDKIKGTLSHTAKDVELTDAQMKDRYYLKNNVGVYYDGSTYWRFDNYGYPIPPQPPINYYKPLGAFANNPNLTKIQIPKSVKLIGRETFANTGLTEVTIASDCVYFSDSFPQGCNIKFYED